jgi:rhomboid protease GluP
VVAGTVGQFCPQCSAERGRQKIVRARPAVGGSLRQAAPVTFFVIAVTVAVFVAGFLSRDLDLILLTTFAQANGLVADGEWWRIFTPVLVHGAAFHILFNMMALSQLGPTIEQRIGGRDYLLLYLACAGVGGVFAFHLGGSNDILVGASGAIFGLFGLWLHAALRAWGSTFSRRVLGSFGLTLALNAALPLIYPQISWQGHLGGFLAGILIAEAWYHLPRSRWRAVPPLVVALTAVLAVSI